MFDLSGLPGATTGIQSSAGSSNIKGTKAIVFQLTPLMSLCPFGIPPDVCLSYDTEVAVELAGVEITVELLSCLHVDKSVTCERSV